MADRDILKERHEISWSTRVKSYPGGYMEIMAADRSIWLEPGWEPADKYGPPPPRGEAKSNKRDSAAAADMRSIRRARARVRDLALANEFGHMVTLTLDRERIDRYDDRAIIEALRQWADNEVRRRGLRYVLVPERHKDGAIHFHGFLAWDRPRDKDRLFVDSGTIKRPGDRPRRPRSEAERAEWLSAGGVVVYNLPRWPYGFSTAVPIWGNYPVAVSYCCKYIGKEQANRAEKIGGRWYYSGGLLREPDISYGMMDFDTVGSLEGGYKFTVPEAGLSGAIWRGYMSDLTGAAERAPDSDEN